MAVEWDNLHIDFREIDGYNKPFNFVISARESGKTTYVILKKIYKKWKEEGRTTLILRRRVVHITAKYIDDFAKIINKFTDDNVVLNYQKGALKEGIVEIYINGKLFITIAALSIEITALKSLIIPSLKYIVFDEFICNPKFKEKYLDDEVGRFKEVFNTFQRESDDIVCYFLGNPYSLFNPYFLEYGVDTETLKIGSIQSGVNFVVWYYKIKKELRDFILKRNPLYQFDEDDYSKYALEGVAVNDSNIQVEKTKPDNFSLSSVFKIDGKLIAVYRNDIYEYGDLKYYASFITQKEISKRRNIFVFDFLEMIKGSVLIDYSDKLRFQKLKDAIRKREIAFNNISCYYLLCEVYKNI